METIKILRQNNKASSALAELKGMARTIPNQSMIINAIVLQEAKDSSEIENIITTQDELYKELAHLLFYKFRFNSQVGNACFSEDPNLFLPVRTAFASADAFVRYSKPEKNLVFHIYKLHIYNNVIY